MLVRFVQKLSVSDSIYHIAAVRFHKLVRNINRAAFRRNSFSQGHFCVRKINRLTKTFYLTQTEHRLIAYTKRRTVNEVMNLLTVKRLK